MTDIIGKHDTAMPTEA